MSLSATAEAAAPRARPALELLADSILLLRDGWKEAAAVAALGIVPGALLNAIAAVAAGLNDPDTLALVLAGGAPGRLAPLAAAGIVSRALEGFMTLALILAFDARDRGAPIGPKEAWRRSFALAAAFLSAFARVAGRALLWSALFVFPGLVSLARGAFFAHAVAIEGLDGKAAAARSRALVSRAPGYLVGNLLGIALLSAGAAIAVVFVLHAGMAAATGLVPSSGGLMEGQLVLLLDRLAGGFIGAWAVGASVLLYKDAATPL